MQVFSLNNTVFSNPSCPVLKELSPCSDGVRCLTKNLKSNRLPLPLEWPFRVLKGSHTPSFSWDPLTPATIGLDLYYSKIKYKYGREYRNMKMVGRSGKTIITLWDHCVHTLFCLLSLSEHSPPTSGHCPVRQYLREYLSVLGTQRFSEDLMRLLPA